MKTKTIAIIALATFSIIHPRSAPFQNLNFELVDSSNIPNGRVGTISQLLPNWELRYLGDNSNLLPGFESYKTGDHFDSIGLNLSGSGLMGWSYATIIDSIRFGPGLEGDYSLYLVGAGWSLRQTGEIPLGTHYLNYTHLGRPFGVKINGDLIGISFPSTVPATVSLNVSDYAGQTVDLELYSITFAAVAGGDFGPALDAISFIAIPEPSTYALLALGAGLLGGRWLWRRR